MQKKGNQYTEYIFPHTDVRTYMASYIRVYMPCRSLGGPYGYTLSIQRRQQSHTFPWSWAHDFKNARSSLIMHMHFPPHIFILFFF